MFHHCYLRLMRHLCANVPNNSREKINCRYILKIKIHLFFYFLISREGVDAEVGQSKIVASGLKNSRNKSSIGFIYTAVRNFSNQPTSPPSSPNKPIEVKSHQKEKPAAHDGNESKLVKVPTTTESRERY
jgi:hypothetical protein